MRRKLLIIDIALALVLPARTTQALVWNVEPAHYIGGIAGNDTSMILNGLIPQVAFTSEGQTLLASKSGGAFTEELVANCGLLGGFCSLAKNTLGQATIAYVDATGMSSYIRYAYKSGSSWATELVDNAGVSPDYLSLAYDPAGTPLIAYTSIPTFGGTCSLKMARRLGANSWAVESVGLVGDQTGPCLAVDSSGKIHIVFVDAGTGRVRLATRVSVGNWSFENIDGDGTNPSQSYYYPSMRYVGNVPHVAYFIRNGSVVSLKYASKTSLTWMKEPVVGLAEDFGQYASIAVSSGGVPSIAYFDSTDQTLGFARKAGSVWLRETVDSGSLTGFRPSMVLDSSDNPLIASCENVFGNVNFASTSPDTIDTAKAGLDGSIVSLAESVASTSGSDLADSIYVQNADRVSGIRVYFGVSPPSWINRGDNLRVSGGRSTIDGERCIIYPTVARNQTGTQPAPFAMGIKALYGGPYYYRPGPPPGGQQGMHNGQGLSMVGLLIKITGRVTSVANGMIYLDDGSGVLDGSQIDGVFNVGVRVICDPGGVMVGEFVSVTGLVSCFSVGNVALSPQILARAGGLELP